MKYELNLFGKYFGGIAFIIFILAIRTGAEIYWMLAFTFAPLGALMWFLSVMIIERHEILKKGELTNKEAQGNCDPDVPQR